MVHLSSPVLVNLHARPSCAAPLVPQEQQCTGDWCSACRIALERISEWLKYQIFLGGIPRDPPKRSCHTQPLQVLPPQNETASYAYDLVHTILDVLLVFTPPKYSDSGRFPQALSISWLNIRISVKLEHWAWCSTETGGQSLSCSQLLQADLALIGR